MTLARVIAEIVALIVSLVVVQWLAATLLRTEGFWPAIVYSAIYLSVRAFFFARRPRSAS